MDVEFQSLLVACGALVLAGISTVAAWRSKRAAERQVDLSSKALDSARESASAASTSAQASLESASVSSRAEARSLEAHDVVWEFRPLWRDGLEVDGWAELVNVGTHEATEVITVFMVDDVTIRTVTPLERIAPGEGVQIDFEEARDPVTRDVEAMMRVTGMSVRTPGLRARVTWRTELGAPRFQFVEAS